ncbi:MAG: NTE family protein [Psychromonas sp.]|jgi:NTE family protein
MILRLLLLISLIPVTSFGQKAPVYRNLIMEGGGILGIAYGGAMLEMEERGMLKDITRVGGTSAGAIQACLLAIGYTVEEISEIISNTPIETFNDDGFVPRGAKRLINNYGWFKGDTFLSAIESLIRERTGNASLTFSDLHNLAISYPFRDLYVVGADLSEQKSVVFSYENYPNMRIADAVRVSMSIPLYYQALWLNKEGKVIKEPSPEDNCHLFVDGGILMNYPIEIFDHSHYIKDYQGEPQALFNTETVGYRLDRTEQIDQELKKGVGIAPYDINDFNSYVSALMSLMRRNVSTPHPEDVNRTIFINDHGISARVRRVPDDEKKELMRSGKQGVIDFLTRTELLRD